MKSVFLGVALLITGSCWADVVELEDATTRTVIDAYEEMQEQEEEVGSDNRWIHDFEKDSVGKEMDHLTGLKRTAETHEEM